ncbi:carboxypeptidase-like regulatory domain-containing protein [Gemmata sp.]|uniref:carboxypeptidase-like regulatory domain-containing protein n=1 Tax=Gemmata sp. TaxID=1914242 RepID=UPI003F70F0FC
MPPLSRLLFAGLILSALGCAQDVNGTVTGRVTHKGKPVANAIVMFVPQSGVAAGGATNQDGTYELTSRALGDGARIGPCKVAVLAADPLNKPLAIPAKYTDPEQSGLAADVRRGPNVFDFDIPEK